MENLQFNSKENKVLQKALITAVNELERLWKIGAVKEIKVPANLIGMKDCNNRYTNDQWYLFIDERGIYLQQEVPNRATHVYTFANRKKNNQLKIITTINQQDIVFLENFDELRKSVIEFVKEATHQKKGKLSTAYSLIEKYTEPATIDIDLPQTNNKQVIEVKEENGKKIGTLNFGNIALRIITSADIEFINKKDNRSVKRK